MNSPKEFAEYLDVLIEKAPALRESGVLKFGLAGLGPVDLVPAAGNLMPTTPPEQKQSDNGDPLDDPMAYGMPPGSQLPWQETEEKGS